MKTARFRLIAGGLIAAILILTIMAFVLILSIVDREIQLQSGEIVWPSATAWPVLGTSAALPTPTIAHTPTQPSLMPTVSTPPPYPALLPSPHPEVGTNPPPCSACHTNIHGVGR